MALPARRALLASATLLVVLTASLVWLGSRPDDGAMSASTAQSGHPAGSAAPDTAGAWRSDDETVGAWLQRGWQRPTVISRVVIGADRDGTELEGSGFLQFSDGSRHFVQLDGTDVELAVTARTVTSVRFTFVEVPDGASSVGLEVLDADDAASGGVAVSASPGADVARSATVRGADPTLVDGSGTATDLDDQAVELRWDRPRELAKVAISGADSGASLRAATLEFSDGSTVPVGAVTDDVTRPTVVAFMPRSTTSLTLRVEETTGGDDVALTALRAFDLGAEPTRPTGQGAGPDTEVTPAAPCAAPGARPDDDVGLVVLCPTNGSAVDGIVTISLAAGPSYSQVEAEVWTADDAGPAGAEAELDDEGRGTVTVDVSDVAAGPFTVAVRAAGAQIRTTVVQLQLVKPGRLASSDPTPRAGRTLVYDDAFDSPLSANRLGEAADYTVGKPEYWGVNDFGSAIFAEPDDGLGNVASGDGYLRLSVEPRPEDFSDYMGWGREHVGGILSSARSGGSGFSAQYGYFEARMRAPANAGTWPAFWMLGTPNLVEPQEAYAEVDAVELYGHDPTMACHTTHQHPDPEEVGQALCGERWDSAEEASDWHTYGVDVRPDRIVYFVDGERVGSTAAVRGVDDPMFFLVNLALGGGWPVELAPVRERAALYVDWIRVYV